MLHRCKDSEGDVMGDDVKQLIRPNASAKIAEIDARENVHPTRDELANEVGRIMASAPELLLARRPQPYGLNCSKRFRAKRVSGQRPLSAIRWIVMHSTEGDTAVGAASWFANPASRGSAHLCVDDYECYRTLENADIPWGAPGTNYGGFHIEQAGHARWTAAIWGTRHNRTLRRAAFKAAWHAELFGLPLRFRTAQQLRAGLEGITDHDECSRAFGGNHWDPGPGWPRGLFMGYVRYYAARNSIGRRVRGALGAA